jgi:NAD(P)-dependent dehydrogenase (short-subunit alcohol dehydrogenase family)
MRLEGKRALITGGGRGIGRAIALAFAAEGADVAVAARTESEVEIVASEIKAMGRIGAAIRCDAGERPEVERAIKEAVAHLGGIDILVANAGMMKHAPLGELSDDIWDETIRVNMSSLFWASRAAIGTMTAQGWGRIIAMSSVSGKIGGAYRSAYHAAKHGVLGFVRSIALEYADRGVTVNAICPGFVDTQMISDGRSDFARYAGNGLDEEETMEMLRRDIPMKRFLDPTEVAAMATYLASDEARGITGQAFTISCGSVQV